MFGQLQKIYVPKWRTNNFWEFSTSKETFKLLKQGTHFAKLPGAVSAPPAVDVCPAVIYHRHREAEWDLILPGAWRGGGSELWHSAGEDVAQPSSWTRTRGRG